VIRALPARIRAVAGTAAWLLPPSRAKNAVLRLCGQRVHPTAWLGVCLVVGVDRVQVGRDAVVGHGNVVRGLRVLRLDEDVRVGHWNWLSAARWVASDEPAGSLVLAAHSALTSRHYVDCSGGVLIGRLVTVGGHRSTVLSHTIDLRSGRQSTAAVVIEDRVFVGSSCTILPGARIAAGSAVGAGAVVLPGRTAQPGMLYVGVPAAPRRPIDGEYFRRTRSWVGR
jgi:carbonic anhydrase/acetyltransferase-like protein (isoleucine patch superfamily)